MRAALDAAQNLERLLAPARAYRYPFECLEVRRDVAARCIGPCIRHRLSLVDQQVEIDRQAQPHVVHGLAGLARAPGVACGGRISLRIDQMAFDVPQPILALVAAALDCAVMHELAGGGRGQRHDMNSCYCR
jgi:hypothetical protein